MVEETAIFSRGVKMREIQPYYQGNQILRNVKHANNNTIIASN